MRVISGKAKGRTIKAVPGMNTRPTTDKVKEAIFSMIGPYFTGGNVLDLFAGTGGLGIEALSRGMDLGIFVDMDRESIETVRDNLTAAGLLEQAEIYRNEAQRALKALVKRRIAFDLVMLDPPYRMKNITELIEYMLEHSLLNNHAYIVAEHDANHSYPEQIGAAQMSKSAVYGEIAVTVYRVEEHTSITGGEWIEK